MKKKICIFCSLSSFATGMPISTYKLAVGLAERGREVCVLLPDEGELAERLRSVGIDVRILSFERLKRDFWKRPWSLPAWAVAGWRLYRYVSIFCSRVVAVSEFARSYFGFGGERARVVYNPGPDRTLFNPDNIVKSEKQTPFLLTTPKLPLSADNDANPTVIAVASFRREKGHHNFLEIASRIKARFSGDVKFMIVGGKVQGHEKYYEKMMSEIKRRGLDGCLTVTGNVPHEDVPKIMFEAAVLLHVPDWEEALGGVILEAMAVGVTVVAYDCGGVGECFTDGVSGVLVERDDFETAADKVVALLKSREIRQRMTLAARDELDSKFTMDNYINGIEKVYDGVLSKGRA